MDTRNPNQPRESDGRLGTVPRDESGLHLAVDNTGPKVFDVTAANGVPFRVALLRAGEAFGATGSLTSEEDMVEFYDARYDFDRHGQFAARYYLSTLRGTDGYGSAGRHPDGLCLHAGISDWRLDGAAMAKVHGWLDEQVLPGPEGPEPKSCQISCR